MKKTIILLTLFILAICTQSSLAITEVSEERVVDAFSEISLRIAATVYLEQGDKQSIEILAKESTMEDIITEVKGNELIIRYPSKNYLWQDFEPGKIEIYITIPEIDALSISGSGDIINNGPISSRILNLAISGSGDILLDDLKADRMKVSISGSGDVDVSGSGKCEDLNVLISGSGDYKGINFATDDVIVKIAGSGDANIYAENTLNIRIVGSGDVTFKGAPLIDQAVLGSGSVKQY